MRALRFLRIVDTIGRHGLDEFVPGRAWPAHAFFGLLYFWRDRSRPRGERLRLALEHLGPHLDRRPLLVSSKGVGRVLNSLLGGTERMSVANGEIVEFAVAPSAGQDALRVTRSYMA